MRDLHTDAPDSHILLGRNIGTGTQQISLTQKGYFGELRGR